MQRLLTPLAAITAAGVSAAVSSQLVVSLLGASLPFPAVPGLFDSRQARGAAPQASIPLWQLRAPGDAFVPPGSPRSWDVRTPAADVDLSEPPIRLRAPRLAEAIRAITGPGNFGRPAPIIRPSAEAVAGVWLRHHAGRFGNESADLRREGFVMRTSLGSLVRFRQYVDDMPVLGGQVNLLVGPDGGVLLAHGEVSAVAAQIPHAELLDAEAGRRAAVEAVADSEAPSEALTAQDPAAWFYDPALFSGASAPAQEPAPVWRVEVADPDSSQATAQTVLVDARNGDVRHVDAPSTPSVDPLFRAGESIAVSDALSPLLRDGAAEAGGTEDPISMSAQLLRDGGAAESGEVTAIGSGKTDELFRAAAEVLTEGTSYADLADVLRDVCSVAGLERWECTSVKAATSPLETVAAPVETPAQGPGPDTAPDAAPVAAVPSGNAVEIAWAAHAWEGSDAVVAWTVTATPEGETEEKPIVVGNVASEIRTVTLAGMQSGRTYDVRVEAVTESPEAGHAWSVSYSHP